MKAVKKKKKEKLVINFDPEARREYLTGFRKRKKLRKAKAKLDKVKQEKKHKKELQVQKKEEVKGKLERYGLTEDKLDNSESVSSLEHHPNHLVVINMQPDFGLSLSSMVDEESKPSNSQFSHKINHHSGPNHQKHVLSNKSVFDLR